MLYRNFEKQEEIDREYNPRFRVKDTAMLLEHFLEESERVRRSIDHRDGIAYGVSPDEVLDFYPAAQPRSPVHCFIHGGYWHSFTSRDFAFVSEDLIHHGVAVVHFNYALCPRVTLDEIVSQCRSALEWVYRNSASLDIDPERISVSGHSAGGHITAMLLATDWAGDYGIPVEPIKSAFPVSGLFDLRPFPFSWLQPKLQLTQEQVKRNSPQFLKPLCRPLTRVLVGSEESGEFIRQSETYAEHLRHHGLDAKCVMLEGENHFTLLKDFHAPGGKLVQSILEGIEKMS